MHDWPVTTIPYPLDVDVFKPIHKNAARTVLNFDLDKKLILFGAVDGSKDDRKGFDLLKRTLLHLAPRYKHEWQCAVFGQGVPEKPIDLGLPVKWMGRVSDEWTLALLYNSADVTVVPSRLDNLPQCGMEAQACGCPVVAFRTGGMEDVVEHQKTGFLAEAFSIEEFAQCISSVLTDQDLNRRMSDEARKRAVNTWSPTVVVPQYVEIFRRICPDRTNPTASTY